VSRLFVLAGVDESDIGSVCTGQPARVTVDAYPGRVFEGRVDRVAPRGVNSAGVVTFEVRVELGGNAADLLKPEMTANVQIVTAEKAGAVLVPLDAVGEGDGRHWVRVVGAAGVESQERSVVLGLSNGEEQEIADGLKPGEWVLADGSARSGAARQGPDPPDGARRNILLPRGLR
jgi:HlyD family secretion protein